MTEQLVATCPRCGHPPRHPQPLADRVRRAVPGLKPDRVVCSEPTDHGWACPCRSRFHAA